jgi:hypothetical protein
MSDGLGEPIRVRLKLSKQAEYEAIASERGQKLGPYLRERLEDDDAVQGELAEIRHLLEELADNQSPSQVQASPLTAGAMSAEDRGMLLEILLLLRAMNPGKARSMQATVTSMGLPVWIPDGE